VKRTLLWGHTDAICKFVNDLAPIERAAWPQIRHGIGVLRGDGALVAGVVFATDRPEFRAWEMSAASVSSHPFSIENVNALGAFAFRQLNIHRIWARTSTDNRRARAMLKALGFTEEGVSADHWGPKKHAITARLLRPEWERKFAASLKEAREAA